jgi:hypothetical protein
VSDIESFTTNISPDEIIAPGTGIEIVLASPVTAKQAQTSVRLTQGCAVVHAPVTLAKRGRVIRVELAEDMRGAFVLVVDELLGVKGEKLVEHCRLPFSVIPVSGKVDPELRIEHAARLVVGDLHVERLSPGEEARGGHVDVLKTVHRETGAADELAFDERGEVVDLGQQLADLAKRRWQKYGALHETLYERVEQAKDGERLPVVIWPRFVLAPAPYAKPEDRRSVEPPAGERKVAASLEKSMTTLRKALQRRKVKVPRGGQADESVPFLRLTATAAQLRELARDENVGVIHFDDASAINDLKDSIAVARSDLAHNAGFDGTGIRVAVFESGPSDTTDLSFAGRFTSSPSASDHARLTSAIIKNTEANKPHGHAPDCDLFSANSSSNDALIWAVRDQHCTVVSQSFHRGTEPGGSGLQSDDLLKDWLALRWPFPTIVQAAGNFFTGDNDDIQPPEDEFVNHKGYNSISVANHDDTAGAISGSSVFRNPSTTHNDRELPEIAANGTGVSAVTEFDSGTSFAAPAAAGVVALLQDVDGVLCSWPEGCRAILQAAAGRNVRDGTWWHDVVNGVDGRDGAGAVDARAGVTIAQQRRGRNSAATRHGWDVGTLASSDFGADRLATFRYRVAVPSGVFFPTVKVVLAWDSAVTSFFGIPLFSALTVDFDLLVRDSRGVLVASAASWDNSYEVAEFSAVRGETYEIVIRRWSGTDSVWYGIAWTVRGIELRGPIDDLVFTRAISEP